MMTSNKFMVRTICSTFNQASLIVDAMNGFTMQRTSFPFLSVIMDDASSDGEPKVIEHYLEENFELTNNNFATIKETDDYRLYFTRHKTNHNCFFLVLLLKYNHQSIKKSKGSYIEEWLNSKYVAYCEGDDYWTDPAKLQMQVDFLEQHPDYTMCWHDAKKLDMNSGNFCGNHRRYTKDTTCPTEDIILQGGGFCPTASIVYRDDIRKQAPPYLFQQHIVDYPLQLYMAFNGKVRYIDRSMSVYRINVKGSWTLTIANNRDIEERRKLWSSTIKIFDDFNKYSNYKYDKLFKQRKYIYLFYEAFALGDYSLARKYWYKCNIFSRPWSLGLILPIHGMGSVADFIKKHAI